MKKIVIMFMIALASMFATSPFAQTTTDYYLENLNPVDTYLRSSVPNTAFGADASLITGGWGDTYITLTKFSVASLSPITTGDKVSVRFYNKIPGGGTAQPTQVNMGLLASDFSEATTWNNSGLSWYTSTVRAVNVSAYGYWTEFDITDYYNYWKGGVANYGFALVPVNTNNYFNVFPSANPPAVAGQKTILRITKANSNRMFSFPLTCATPVASGSTCTVPYSNGAYTPGKVISILDHDMTVLYTEKNGRITSFTGEQFATTSSYPTSAPQACYPKVGGTSWSSTLQSLYVGTNGSGYKNCSSGVSINYEAHPGYDYKANYSTEVFAVYGGKVVDNAGQICVPKGMSNNCASFNAVGVDHGNGYITQYLHLGSISVTAGQSVKQGDKIGLSGDIGVTGNPHLHFEVLKRRSGYVAGDYQIAAYATVDPYGFDASLGVQDVLANSNGTPSVCLWLSGCTLP